MTIELACFLFVLSFLALLAVYLTCYARYVVEAKEFKLLKAMRLQLYDDTSSMLKTDYENLQEWIEASEKLKSELEGLKQDLTALKESFKNQPRDKQGRFAKKEA